MNVIIPKFSVLYEFRRHFNNITYFGVVMTLIRDLSCLYDSTGHKYDKQMCLNLTDEIWKFDIEIGHVIK